MANINSVFSRNIYNIQSHFSVDGDIVSVHCENVSFSSYWAPTALQHMLILYLRR